MQENPFPQTIRDETSGIEVPNQRHQDWQAGYATGALDAAKVVLFDIPKALGIRLPIISDFLSKLK